MKKYFEENPYAYVVGLLFFAALVSAACRTSAIGQPTLNTAPTVRVPAVLAVYEQVEPTPMTVGNVTAEVLHIRADHDLSADVLDYLYSNDLVLEMDCFTSDNIVWVKHETGWSVVRNATAEYIAGVCDE